MEQLLQVDVPSSLNKIRFIAEKVLHTLCVRHAITWGQAEPTLERMLGPCLISQGVIPKNTSVHVRTIQANSSPGSHYQESALSPSHAIIAQQALVEFLEWYSTSAQPMNTVELFDALIIGSGKAGIGPRCGTSLSN